MNERTIQISAKGYVICEWCGCEAWWPKGEGKHGCDCDRTMVLPDGRVEVAA